MKVRLFFVFRKNDMIPELTSHSEREAYMALGKWVLPYDLAYEGSLLVQVGRACCMSGNPFRVVDHEIEIEC